MCACVCVCVCAVCLHASHLFLLPAEVRRGCGSLELQSFLRGCEPLCDCWESNLDLLQKQPSALPAEPSLQLPPHHWQLFPILFAYILLVLFAFLDLLPELSHLPTNTISYSFSLSLKEQKLNFKGGVGAERKHVGEKCVFCVGWLGYMAGPWTVWLIDLVTLRRRKLVLPFPAGTG